MIVPNPIREARVVRISTRDLLTRKLTCILPVDLQADPKKHLASHLRVKLRVTCESELHLVAWGLLGEPTDIGYAIRGLRFGCMSTYFAIDSCVTKDGSLRLHYGTMPNYA